MKIRNSFAVSLIFHSLVFALALLIQWERVKPGIKEYIVRIVEEPAAKHAPRMPTHSVVREQELTKTAPVPSLPNVMGDRSAVESPPVAPSLPGLRPPAETSLPSLTGPSGQALPSRPRPSTLPDRRSQLFDSEIIERVAESPQSKNREIGFETDEYRYMGYMRKLKDRIESVWRYPPTAAEKGIYGDLRVEFVIRRDGTLGSVRVTRTSGWSMLDEAAMAAIRSGAPYWPLPSGAESEALTINGHFIYHLNGTYDVR